jgi:hypothetical protein
MRTILDQQVEMNKELNLTNEHLRVELKVAKDEQRTQEVKQTCNKDLEIAALKTNVEALILKHTLELEANNKAREAEVKQLRDANTKDVAVKVQELERKAAMLTAELRVAKDSPQQEEGTAVKVQQLEGEAAMMAEEARQLRVAKEELEDIVYKNVMSQIDNQGQLEAAQADAQQCREQVETVDHLFKLKMIRLEDRCWEELLQLTLES